MYCLSSESVVLKDGYMGCVISNAIARPLGVTVLVWVCRDGYRGLQALAISHRWGFQMAIVRVLHNTCYHFIALVGEGRGPRNPGTGPLKTRALAADDDHDYAHDNRQYLDQTRVAYNTYQCKHYLPLHCRVIPKGWYNE